jgi:serine/threonine protein kinase
VQAGSENRAGDMLAEKYRLEELLGSGGMGHVYRATNELVGRAVAIKLLRPELASNTQIVERFLREARAANLVRHPNVVDVVDIGKDESGTPFIVQELLSGQDLSRYAAQKKRLSLEEVVDLLCPVIDAVAEAHTRGVVHRDIKPENVFLAREKSGKIVPKLLDFGISKMRTTSDVRSTEAGVMMGTPAYMPPEQLHGAKDADARSDVWALGVMLFELLSGRLPFDVPDAPALFVAIATRDAPTLSDVSPDVAPAVSKIVERCLRRNPEERYPTAAELARDLRLMTEGQELEPTGKRSIPPEWRAAAGNAAMDVKIPPSPIAPTLMSSKPPPAPSNGALKAKDTPSVPDLPDLPDLPVPAPKPKAETKPKPGPAASSTPVSRAPATKPATPQALDGVVMGPTSSVSVPTRPRPAQQMYEAPGTGAAPPPDMGWVVGLCAVTLIALGVIGGLMSVAHSANGWGIVRVVLPGNGTAIAAGQSLMALVVAVIGGRHGKKAFEIWNGDATGGRSGAVVAAAITGGLFFAAIELVRAAF